MPSFSSLYANSWYTFLEPAARVLVTQSYTLLFREERLQTTLEDYSFIVFPMGKAYEGFIKQYLKAAGIITRPDYNDSKFRIGRALNPDISLRHKDEWWLFDDLERACGNDTARHIWSAWLECRNHIFHYYVGQHEFLTLAQAKKKIDQINTAMTMAMACLQTKT